jgi:hypothetical protein
MAAGIISVLYGFVVLLLLCFHTDQHIISKLKALTVPLPIFWDSFKFQLDCLLVYADMPIGKLKNEVNF